MLVNWPRSPVLATTFKVSVTVLKDIIAGQGGDPLGLIPDPQDQADVKMTVESPETLKGEYINESPTTGAARTQRAILIGWGLGSLLSVWILDATRGTAIKLLQLNDLNND